MEGRVKWGGSSGEYGEADGDGLLGITSLHVELECDALPVLVMRDINRALFSSLLWSEKCPNSAVRSG